jgi:dTMP kinase
MTWEAELLLMNASRAQLVREFIRPALDRGDIIISDRFYDSTTAYQGHGRQLNLAAVQRIVDFAVGDTRPDLTLLFTIPAEVSAQRLRSRQATLPFVRDRIEEGDRAFFDRVVHGYEAIALSEPHRVRKVDGNAAIETVQADVWRLVEPRLPRR